MGIPHYFLVQTAFSIADNEAREVSYFENIIIISAFSMSITLAIALSFRWISYGKKKSSQVNRGNVFFCCCLVFDGNTQVVKAIENAIPVRHAAAAAEIDPAREEELRAMEAEKAEIDRAAAARVRRELWCGLTYLVIQTAGFMRLTFWELSWDVMEPICFYVTSMYFMAGYAFFLRTKKEPSFEGFFESRFAAKQKRVMRARGFDLRRYEELRRACGVAAAPPPPLQARTPCASAAAARESGHCQSYCHCH
jgi:calcium uniporter protein, mitochondrial